MHTYKQRNQPCSHPELAKHTQTKKRREKVSQRWGTVSREGKEGSRSLLVQGVVGHEKEFGIFFCGLQWPHRMHA